MFNVPHLTYENKTRHTMTRIEQHPQQVTALVAVLAPLAAFTGIWAPTATAQDDAKGDAQASSVLIMDASSSMLQPDGDGTRMDSAKKPPTNSSTDFPIPPPWA